MAAPSSTFHDLEMQPSAQPRRWPMWRSLVVVTLLVVAGLWSVDARTRPLVANTLILSLITSIYALGLSFPLAWLLTRSRPYGRMFFEVGIAVALFLPLYLQLTGWQAGFGHQGWLQSYIGTLSTRPLLAGWRGAIWVHTMAAIPWATMILAAGLRAVPVVWEETALLESGRWHTFWHVTLPCTRPAWTVALLWIVAMTAGEMTVTDVFRIRTFAEEAFLAFALGDPQSIVMANGVPVAGNPAAPPWLTITLGGGLTLWMSAAMYGALQSWLPAGRTFIPQASRDDRWVTSRWMPTLVLSCALLLLWGIPLANLALQAGLRIDMDATGLHRSWSLAKALAYIGNAPLHFKNDYIWSFACINLVAVSVLVIGVPWAWWAASTRWGGAVSIMAIAVGLVIPGPLVGIGIIGLLNHDTPLAAFLYDRTLLAPCLAMTVRALPLALLVLWQAFRSLPTAPLDAARLDGAGPWRLLLSIVLPQRLAAIVTAAILAMAISIGELAASVLVAPPGVNTLSITIFGLVHYGVDDRLAGLCLSQILMFALIGLLFCWQLPGRRRDYN